MNERIRELAEQAGLKVNADGEIGPAYFGSVDAGYKKFAELLIRECVEQCNINFVGTVGTHPNAHNRGVQKCIDNIKQYFGVE